MCELGFDIFSCRTARFSRGGGGLVLGGSAENMVVLMMEAGRTSETLVNLCQATRRSNPEDSHLRTLRREDLKSNSTFFFSGGGGGYVCSSGHGGGERGCYKCSWPFSNTV
jgi:hypothetical protein